MVVFLKFSLVLVLNWFWKVEFVKVPIRLQFFDMLIDALLSLISYLLCLNGKFLGPILLKQYVILLLKSILTYFELVDFPSKRHVLV